jgi:hypothetical protein
MWSLPRLLLTDVVAPLVGLVPKAWQLLRRWQHGPVEPAQPAGLPDAASGGSTLDLVTEQLDPVLEPLGFAPGQAGVGADSGQVIFCRGAVDSPDGNCVDLVVDLGGVPAWRVVDVRYWGFPADRWHLAFDRDAALRDQLTELAQSLPRQLTAPGGDGST